MLSVFLQPSPSDLPKKERLQQQDRASLSTHLCYYGTSEYLHSSKSPAENWAAFTLNIIIVASICSNESLPCSRIMLLNMNAYISPGGFLKCKFQFIRSGAEPEILHFSKLTGKADVADP